MPVLLRVALELFDGNRESAGEEVSSVVTLLRGLIHHSLREWTKATAMSEERRYRLSGVAEERHSDFPQSAVPYFSQLALRDVT